MRMRLSGLGFSGILLVSLTCPSSVPSGGRADPAPVVTVPHGPRIELPPLRRIPAASPVAVERKPALRPARKAEPVASPSRPAQTERVTRISGYVYCGSAVVSAQRCIDAGKLTLYYPAGVKTLAGHNYMGWSWMDDLPVGRKVVIVSGSLAGTYRVYGHGWAKRGSQGGRFPAAGRGAAVALQTCTSSGTGFSFLRRV